MNENRYKAAVDSVKFSENFERDTIAFLRRAAKEKKQKENDQMNRKKPIKVTVLVTALIVILAVTAYALTVFLSPKEVAAQAGDHMLAQAFDSKDAIIINQSVQAGEYTITLGGIVSGKELTDFCEDVQEDKSYIVASVAYTDGREVTQSGEANITFSPLVSGYKPWQVNAWTLGGGYEAFIYEGVNYYIFECSNLEIFADHTVYLAAYEGDAPDAETFFMNENGEISFTDGFVKPHAMFTLPFDEKKADPDAVSRFMESAGIIIE